MDAAGELGEHGVAAISQLFDEPGARSVISVGGEAFDGAEECGIGGLAAAVGGHTERGEQLALRRFSQFEECAAVLRPGQAVQPLQAGAKDLLHRRILPHHEVDVGRHAGIDGAGGVGAGNDQAGEP